MSLNKLTAVLAVLCFFIPQLTLAAPDGGQVAAGSATISQSGNTTTINQTSPSAVINWHGFDTASGESVVFNQPNENSTALNRITSGLPTNFAGNLTANGRVFIVNPNGMVFAKGSSVNAASILATTADIKDADFMSGHYNFYAVSGHGNPSIVNNGTLTATTPYSGFIALIAPTVINSESGMIEADFGRVVLSANPSYVLDFNKDQLINFDVSSAAAQGYIKNMGTISAYQGRVYLVTPRTVEKVLDTMTSTAGIKEASTVVINPKNNSEVNLVENEPKRGSIINTGNITASNITLFAASDITLDGFIKVSAFGGGYGYLNCTLRITSLTGNIAINAPIKAVYDVVLYANTISEAKTGYITAPQLYMTSENGANMAGKNAISGVLDIRNTQSGGVYFRNYAWFGPVSYFDPAAIAGGYKPESISFWTYYFGD